MCPGHKTYFIESRQISSPYDHNHCPTFSNPVNLRLIISPAVSPQSILSFNHSPLPISAKTSESSTDEQENRGDAKSPNNFLSPSPFNFRNKASSLPSILDSDAEIDEQKRFPDGTDNSSKSPTSVGKFIIIKVL